MFTPIRSLPSRHRLVLSLDGPPDSGKTHFMMTAPRPLKISNIDFGIEGVRENMEEAGWDFTDVSLEDFSLEKAPLTSSHAIDRARNVVARFKTGYMEGMKEKRRTTFGIDTCSEFWQLFRLAALGKLEQVPPMRYVQVNRVFRDLLNQVLMTHHSLVLIHRTKDKYETKVTESGQEVSSKVNGETERDGFKEIDGIVQVVLNTQRRTTKKGAAQYGFTVGKCRQRPSLTRQEYWGDMATFQALALDVFPDSKPKDWE